MGSEGEKEQGGRKRKEKESEHGQISHNLTTTSNPRSYLYS